MYKYFLPLVAAALLLVAYSGAQAAPLYSAQRSLIPFADSQYFLGTTTPGTLAWKGAVVDELCLTGDVCITAWPTGGGGTISTSTDLVDGQVIVATGADTIAGITNVATGRVLISQGASAAPIWSETVTLGVALNSPLIRTNANTSLANFSAGSASGVNNQISAASHQLNGSTNMQSRVFFNGSANTVLTANASVAFDLFGAQPAVEATSGTHDLIANVGIGSAVITNGTAATTNFASLYIDGAATGTFSPTNNYALWVNDNGGGGTARFDGSVGIGTSTPPRTFSVQTSASPNVASFLGSNASYINVHRTSQASNSGLQLGVNSSGGYEVFGKTTHSLRLGTNDTEYVTILNGGNTGIGTSTPFTKLGVAGDAYIGGNLTATGTVAVTATATSTFSGPVRSTCFSTDGTTCLSGGGGVAEDEVQAATVTLSSSDILNIHSTPITLVAAPGAGKQIIVDQVVIAFDAGASQYANGDTLVVTYNGATSPSLVASFASALFASATDATWQRIQASATITDGVNQPVTIRAQSTAFITGDGTAKVFIRYRVITL